MKSAVTFSLLVFILNASLEMTMAETGSGLPVDFLSVTDGYDATCAEDAGTTILDEYWSQYYLNSVFSDPYDWWYSPWTFENETDYSSPLHQPDSPYYFDPGIYYSYDLYWFMPWEYYGATPILIP